MPMHDGVSSSSCPSLQVPRIENRFSWELIDHASIFFLFASQSIFCLSYFYIWLGFVQLVSPLFRASDFYSWYRWALRRDEE
jgi:hypothetical protein